VLVTISPYRGLKVLHFPGSFGLCGEERVPHQLDLLITQMEWPLGWSALQLDELTSARSFFWSKNTIYVRGHIAFWVTAHDEQVKFYLDTKLSLAQRLLDHCQFDLTAKHSVVLALNRTIHEGGRVIDILTRHLYCNCFPGRQPWIRHRFKKLVLIQSWLTDVFCLLLTKGYRQVAKQEHMDELRQHAQQQNARTLRIWTKAVKRSVANRFLHRGMDSSEDDNDSVDARETESESDWESDYLQADDDSDWETEEEIDDGQPFGTARDRDGYDTTNPDLDGRPRYSGNLYEYDEEYWSHLYNHCVGSKVHISPEKPKKSIGQKLTRYAQEFLSGVV
jgi:cytidylate kinase